MSATLARPLPTPGLATVPDAVGSIVPSGVVRGDPMLRPCPAMVRQFTPSTRPAVVQVSLLVMMPVVLTAPPGKLRYLEAMLPVGARASNAGVSYHPEPVLVELLGVASYAK